ncbi:hypothetical protein BUALT_Bualt10G0072400 [Buddleja alternifolia]|uniref:Cadmium-induced protein AS8 n=1 Tax=Buddleja alternifolia TaxID=168488 RepID=A0AAV6X4W9_9LAMI|nr:hypothetical protein BUALT_Bualt10G0072400 [Buddleja alternifolia]
MWVAIKLRFGGEKGQCLWKKRVIRSVFVDMILKNLFKKYEGWNPVHPTYGAFWGIGVGIGCGVGWGPGFGPEVIGYVGAGCGAGFSVGFTLLGLGVGLPVTIPHSGFTVSGKDTLNIARARDILGNRSRAGDGGAEIVNLPNLKSMLVSPCNHISDCLQRVHGGFFPWDKGDLAGK